MLSQQPRTYYLPSTPDIAVAFEEQGIPIAEESKPKSPKITLYDQFNEDRLIQYLNYISTKLYFCALNNEVYEGDNIGIFEVYMDEHQQIAFHLDGACGETKTIYGSRLIIRDDYVNDITDFLLKLIKRINYCISCESFDVFSTLCDKWCKECYFMDMYKRPDDKCSICMEHLSELPIFLTECKHYFHIKCLHGLSQHACQYEHCTKNNKKKCPLCRSLFSSNHNMVAKLFP